MKDFTSNNGTTRTMHETDSSKGLIQLTTEIASLFTTSENSCDFVIEDALAMFGKYFSASRVYVMLDERDARYLRNTHEWVNSTSVGVMHSWPLYDCEHDIPSLKYILDTQKYLFGNVSDLPEDIQKVLSKQKVKTNFMVPLMRDGGRIGVLGMDFCDNEHAWNNEVKYAFHFLAVLISLALERKQFNILRGKLGGIMGLLEDVEPLLAKHKRETETRISKPLTLQESERRIIIETLEQYNGNKLKTAKHLGLTWPSLDRRCKKLGIEVKRK